MRLARGTLCKYFYCCTIRCNVADDTITISVTRAVTDKNSTGGGDRSRPLPVSSGLRPLSSPDLEPPFSSDRMCRPSVLLLPLRLYRVIFIIVIIFLSFSPLISFFFLRIFLSHIFPLFLFFFADLSVCSSYFIRT